MKIKFSKDDTLAIKGIAILFLLQYHNFFQRSRFENYEVSFFPFSADTVVTFTRMFKICVSIFVFLSAYGLTLSLKKYNSETGLNGKQYIDYLHTRLIKLMWGFWFVFLFSSAVIAIIQPDRFLTYFQNGGIGGAMQGIGNIILDFTGLAFLMGTPTLNGTWWYMSLAIFIVIIVPFISSLNKKYNVFFAALLCLFIPRIIMSNNFTVGENNNLIRWIFTVVLGVAFAQNDVLVRMKSFRLFKSKAGSKIVKFIIATLILLIFCISYIKFNGSISNYTYEFKEGIVSAFVVYYCYEFIIDIPVVRNILALLGKHSMNIFLVHTFIRGAMFADFTYSFGNWLLIDLVLLLDSLAVSIVIELIKKYSGYNKLLNKVLKKIEKKNSEKVV